MDRRIRMSMEFLRTPTKRETEVLKLTAAGCYQAEIAQILFISECTVQNHVRSTLHKLNARNSHQALKKMYDLKLLTVEDIPSLIDIVTSR